MGNIFIGTRRTWKRFLEKEDRKKKKKKKKEEVFLFGAS